MRNQRFHHSIHMTTLYHNLATTESLRNLIHIYSNNTIHWTQISTHNDIAYISTIQYEEKTVSTLKRNICNTTKEIKYDLRTKNLLKVPKVKISTYGQSYLFFRGSMLWSTLSDSMKCAQSTESFKIIIRSWKGEKCHCNIFR